MKEGHLQTPEESLGPAETHDVLVMDLDPKRLDKLLTVRLPMYSRTRWQRSILDGNVFLCGIAIKERDHIVNSGEWYRVCIPSKAATTPLAPSPMDVLIHYEDEAILILEKPPGLVVHPGAGHQEHTLVHKLLTYCGSQLSTLGGMEKLGIVHRLDKDTSGLMVVAKTNRAHENLSGQFASRMVKKTYYAMVKGCPKNRSGVLEHYMGRHPVHRQRMAVLALPGRLAVTHYEVVAIGKEASMLLCKPVTGRTHQLRVHCSHMGHPILGDTLYGSMEGYHNRQALHSGFLSFHHPETGNPVEFQSPLPEDMQQLYEKHFEKS